MVALKNSLEVHAYGLDGQIKFIGIPNLEIYMSKLGGRR